MHFLLSTLLRDYSLCWDSWKRYMTPTLDAALLCIVHCDGVTTLINSMNHTKIFVGRVAQMLLNGLWITINNRVLFTKFSIQYFNSNSHSSTIDLSVVNKMRKEKIWLQIAGGERWMGQFSTCIQELNWNI